MSFLDSEKVIHQFNISVENYNKSKAAEKLDAFDKTREFRDYSANSIYKSLEWALKRHMSIYYDKKFSEGKISSVKRDEQKAVLNTTTANIVFLINEVKKTEINPIILTSIDFKLIQNMKKQVRNSPEHSATEISTTKLRKVIDEVRKVIKHLVDNNAILTGYSGVNEKVIDINTFDELFIACDRFDTKSNIYVFATGDTESYSLSSLAKIPWSLIIDFNPEAKSNGLFHEYEKEFSLSPHYININHVKDYVFLKSPNLPYYFFGNGDIDIKDTLVTELKDWRRKYTPVLTMLLSYFAEVYDRNIKVIISHDNYAQLEILCQQFDITYNDRVQFIITAGEKSDIDKLRSSYNVVHIPVKVPEICLGIESYSSYFDNRQHNVAGTITIPGKDGLTKYSSEQYGMMNEDFEIVHNEIALMEIKESETVKTPIDFFKGEQISWYGLQDHFDIERNKTKSLLNTIRQYLKSKDNNITTLIKILHDPGVGGTTTLKRIGWELHDDNPTIILKQFREGATLANINKLYHLTNRPLLVLAEANQISSDIIVKLFNSVKRSTVPAVFIMLQRGSSIKETDTTKYINYLNDNELRFFIEKYKPYLHKYSDTLREKKEKELLSLYGKHEMVKRSPFYLGLITFEEDFVGIEDYITKFIKLLKPIQRKILLYVSFIGFYAHKSVPAHLFSKVIKGVDSEYRETDLLNLNDYLPRDGHFDSILIKEIKNDVEYWKPRHDLFSKEIIIQLLSGVDSRKYWKQNLLSKSVEFIEDTEMENGIVSQEILNILRAMFITRENDAIINEQFSKLINDLRETQHETSAVGIVFEKLTKCYPEESHFWAHLARYYSYEEERADLAITNINKAIEVSQKKDPLLYHIKGICIKNDIANEINNVDRVFNSQLSDKKLQIDSITDTIKLKYKDAAEQFEITRGLDHELHGYISQIQLITDIIDMGYRVSLCENRSEFFQKYKDSWYVECLDEATSLLELAKNIDLENNDYYLSKAENKILKLFGEYGAILQTWNNLLPYSRDKDSIRRLIVRTQIERCNGFENMSQELLDQLLGYLEENIQNEPSNGTNINLWFQAARYCNKVSTDMAIAKVNQWKVNTDLINSYYYSYVLNVIKAENGFAKANIRAKELVKECSYNARFFPNRTKVYEWFGKGKELEQLVSNKIIDLKNVELKQQKLKLLVGIISEWEHPGAGKIEFLDGIKIYFRPSQGNMGKGITFEDLGKKVYFFAGFSYDGIRADDSSVVTEFYLHEYTRNGDSKKEAAISTNHRKLHVDEVVDCTVVKITKIFAKVKIDGINDECSIHISQLNQKRYIEKIEDVLKIGDPLQAKVINFDTKYGWELSLKDVHKKNQIIMEKFENKPFMRKINELYDK